MIRSPVRRLLVVAVVALSMVAGVIVPLRAAPVQPAGSQRAKCVMPLPASITSTTQVTAPRLVDAPTATYPPSVPPSPAPPTSPLPIPSPPLSPTLTEPLIPPQATTESLVPTATLTPVLAATVTPVLTPSAAPIPAQAPVVAPTRSPVDQFKTLLSQNWRWTAVICLIPLLLLGLLLVLRTLRAKSRPRPPTPPSPVTAGPYLESVGTPGGPRRFDLKPDGFTIGRAPDSDLVITQDLAASRYHARIYRQVDRWIVEDLDSMNGVYVNGRRTGRNLLRDGWRLRIGGAEFVFHTGTGEA
jgi:hypothetical protein